MRLYQSVGDLLSPPDFRYFLKTHFLRPDVPSNRDRLKPNKAVDLMAPSARLVSVQTSHFYFTSRLKWESVEP